LWRGSVAAEKGINPLVGFSPGTDRGPNPGRGAMQPSSPRGHGAPPSRGLAPWFGGCPGPGSGPGRLVPGGGCGRGPPRPASSGSRWCSPRCCRSCSPAGEADGLRASGPHVPASCPMLSTHPGGSSRPQNPPPQGQTQPLTCRLSRRALPVVHPARLQGQREVRDAPCPLPALSSLHGHSRLWFAPGTANDFKTLKNSFLTGGRSSSEKYLD